MASATPKLHILTFELVPNSNDKVLQLREAQHAYAAKIAATGNVILAGPVEQPAVGALMIVRNLSEKDIEKLVKEDPLYSNGLVSKYSIKPYFAVVGDNALKNDFVKL